MDIHNETAVVEHEATTSKISEDQIFYCNQRGIPTEDAIGLIVNGYAKEVLNKLPMGCGRSTEAAYHLIGRKRGVMLTF